MTRWKRVATALARLAEDQRGTPEGRAAREKLKAILAKYPDACDYEPVQRFTAADLQYILRHQNLSTEGRWEGRTAEDALRKAFAELGLRVDQHREANRPRREMPSMTETRATYQPGSTSGFDIPLCVPHLDGNEARYVADALARNEIAMGDYLPRFERMVSEYVGVAHAVAVSSGTAALHLALLAAGVGPGTEVILPALTFIAPANAVRYCGATPVFVDVDPETWGMDGESARHAQSDRTRAALPVHLLGHPIDAQPIFAVAVDFGLSVIEDATESLGAVDSYWRVGRPLDFHSHRRGITCLSFNGNKLITTGGGGMVLTGDADLAARIRYLSTQARDDPAEYVHREIGYNYRMSNLAAAVGCAQMERIGDKLAAKRRIAERYAAELAGVPGIAFHGEAPWARSAYWLSTIQVDAAAYGMDARALRARLAENGIESRTLWQPLHLSPAHADSYRGPLPVAESLWRTALSLPSSVGLTEAQQQRVIDAIRRR